MTDPDRRHRVDPDDDELAAASSGDEAIRAAAERAERTRAANIPAWGASRCPTTPPTCGWAPSSTTRCSRCCPWSGCGAARARWSTRPSRDPLRPADHRRPRRAPLPVLGGARLAAGRPGGAVVRPAAREVGLVAPAARRHHRVPAGPPDGRRGDLLRNGAHPDVLGAADRRDRPHVQRQGGQRGRPGSTASSTTATWPTSRSGRWSASPSSRTPRRACSAWSAERARACPARGPGRGPGGGRGPRRGRRPAGRAARRAGRRPPARRRRRGAGRAHRPGHRARAPGRPRPVRALLADVDLAAAPDEAREAGEVELAVHYDGEDLELVARDADRSIETSSPSTRARR